MIEVIRRCGRLDDHPPHRWFGRWWSYLMRDEDGNLMHPAYWCKGRVRVEGGHRGEQG